MTIEINQTSTPAGQPRAPAPSRAEPINYAELGRAAREIAGGLAALGIERGDHVGDPRPARVRSGRWPTYGR